MSVYFKASSSNGGDAIYSGELEDLGMCYVSRIVIDEVEMFSVIPATPEPTAEERKKKDDEVTETFGYKIDYSTIEYHR